MAILPSDKKGEFTELSLSLSCPLVFSPLAVKLHSADTAMGSAEASANFLQDLLHVDCLFSNIYVHLHLMVHLSSMSLGLSSELSLSAWILALLPASAPAGWKINEFPSGSPSSSSAPFWKLCFLLHLHDILEALSL